MAFKKAFTLAEILITLTIIGVIASFTVPILSQQVQDVQLRIAWKEDFQIFSQAGKRIASDYGSNLSGLFGSNLGNENIMRDYLLKYLNYIKKCDDGRLVNDECWHDIDKWYKLSGQSISDDMNGFAGFIMNNGTLVLVDYYSINCNHPFAANGDGCGYITVDVNGFNGPNKIGKDIFEMFLLKSGTVSPLGTKGDEMSKGPQTYGCNPSDNDTYGWCCSADYLYK